MKAISLWQPWATAMALGLKVVETRHWRHGYRGPLAIHAAKRWQRDERDWARELAENYDTPELAEPPLGAIVAVGMLCRIDRTEDARERLGEMELMLGNYAPGRFAWLFQDVRALPSPIPFKGAQGIFEIPDDLIL